MNSLKDTTLESNPCLKINFDGGDLSSDAGLLLIKEFADKIGLVCSLYDDALFRIHVDPDNLLQVIYQTIAAYFEDDCADELTVDPVFTAILDKDALTSQPTLSRFYNRMDETTLEQFAMIEQAMRDIVYAIKPPEHMLFDLDSTLLNTYGHQEGEAFNFHYQAHGYHPLVCYDGITGDLLKLQLRDGSAYSSNGVADFLRPLLEELSTYPFPAHLSLRGDSGFATPELYDLCEEENYNVSYAIRLKQNSTLIKLAQKTDELLYKKTSAQ